MGEKFFNLLDAIRKKPESTRWMIVIAITIVVAAFSLLLSGWNMSRQFENLARGAEDRETERALVNPLDSIRKTWEAIQSGNELELEENEEDLIEKEGRLTAKMKSGFAAVGEAARFNMQLVAEMIRDLIQ